MKVARPDRHMRTLQTPTTWVLLLGLAAVASCGGREAIGDDTGGGGGSGGDGGTTGTGGSISTSGSGGTVGTSGAGGTVGTSGAGGGTGGGAAGSVGTSGAGGSCGPVCAIYCQWGNVSDGRGCPTCACNPPPPCSLNECPPPPPLPPGGICPDGTPYQISCQRFDSGMCGWTAGACKNPCPPVCDIYCPYGNRVDERGCALCTCNEPPSCAAYGDASSCTGDMRCTWLAPGCGEPALAAQGCYARTDVGCQSDSACPAGRSCLKRVVNPCLPMANGAACAACGLTTTVCL